MEKRIKVLEDLGFSKNEAIVYLTLLNLGSSTATVIADKSKLHRTTVYDVLDRLVEKGMVSYISKEDTKYFQASDPESLLGVLKKREDQLKSIIPELKLSDDLAESKDKAKIFEGVKGIKAITEDILVTCKEGDEVFTFGNPKNTSELMKSFVDLYHKRRIAKGIKQIHIYNENAKERIRVLQKMDLTDAAYLPKEYDSPAATTVYGDKVAFFVWGDNPLAILIESKVVAESYRNYFKLLWGMVKK